MAELDGKIALVTGGGRGIGRSVVLELAKRGAQVAVAARSEAEVKAVAAEIEKSGKKAFAISVDLNEPSASKILIEQVKAELGAIDILINNAAIAGPYGASWEIDPEKWAQAININLIAPFRLAQAVLPDMIAKKWGRIINVSSGAARNAMERAGAYSTTKAGLDMMSRQLGIELQNSGVAVISLYPGVVDTAMQTEIRQQPMEKVGEALAQRFKGYYESGQLQSPERPASLIVALSGEAGESYNSQIVTMSDPEVQHLIS